MTRPCLRGDSSIRACSSMFDISSIEIEWALDAAPPSEESPATFVKSLPSVSLSCQRTGGSTAAALADDEAPLAC